MVEKEKNLMGVSCRGLHETNNKKIFFALIIGLIVGAGLGFYYCYHNNIKIPEERIDYLESIILEPGNHFSNYPFNVNDYKLVTIGQVSEIYFRYHYVSRGLLKMQVERICGIRN